MPLALSEIRNRAFGFAHEWQNEGDEIADAQSFLNEFLNVFGVARRRVAVFEYRVTLTEVVSDSWWKLVFGVAPDHDGCSIRRRGQSAS